MTTLATIADYKAITGETPDTDRVRRLLELASSAVLAGAHGQQIISAETVSTVQPFHGVIHLPQRPVTDVASVVLDGTVIDPTSYRIEAGGNRQPARLVALSAGRDTRWAEGNYTVTYTAGWEEVPGPIVMAVITMTHATILSGGGPAIRQEMAGPLQVLFDKGAAPDMTLSIDTRRMLDRLCGLAPPTSVPGIRDYP